jgi:hypothetical protein
MSDRLMFASAVFLYVMAILEAVYGRDKSGDRLITVMYVVLAFTFMAAWAVTP